ncbi:MAG: efflux RND transporter periplasmic adaptor subunit [Candidatus Cloacimonadaceae bacterium]
MKRYIKYIVIAIILIAVIFGYMSCRKKKNRPEWRTDTTSFGNIREVVTATGSLNPYVLVEVGTEVSGKIEKLYKDFNDNVKRGELLATLDTELLRTALESSRAELTKAQTSQAEAKLDHDNLVELVKHGMAAEYDLRKAEFRMQQAQQSLATARLNLQRAQKNLDNAYIKSPIDGVIVGRSVDEGQTVAASLNAPTLFKIANNLDKMQITANVDEADIGRIKVGLPVEFSVDAYTTMAFTGEVQQIRLNPVTEQNVVSYSVIIDADNPGRVLLPGMTTNVTIIVKSRQNTMRIPETATRFRPSKELWTLFGLKWEDDMIQKEREKAMEELQKELEKMRTAQSEEGKDDQDDAQPRRGRGGGQGGGGGMPSGGFGMMGMGGGGSMSAVWILKDDKPMLRMVQTGISDGAFVEVISGIKEGETLISGVVYKNSKQAAVGNPMGGPGMRRF